MVLTHTRMRTHKHAQYISIIENPDTGLTQGCHCTSEADPTTWVYIRPDPVIPAGTISNSERIMEFMRGKFYNC